MRVRKEKKSSFLGRILLILGIVICIFQGITLFFPEQEQKVRQSTYDWLRHTFPRANLRVSKQYGLFPYQGQGDVKTASANAKRVVLIHGLDEPGRIFDELARVLSRAGVEVWFFRYPNDQAIERSARYFMACLSNPTFDKEDRLTLVAHSMGGLVARQMLTDPDISYIPESSRANVPRISKLIMIGTPNHGAELARFRIVMEIREQVLNLVLGQGLWYQGLFDGCGAAGLDLLPGSSFLSELNARPHPHGVDMMVVAGRINTFLPDVLGDGLVSANSARISGISFAQVKGSHRSMLKNVFYHAPDRQPPAIPVILYFLGL